VNLETVISFIYITNLPATCMLQLYDPRILQL